MESSLPINVSVVEPSGLLYGSELALLEILEVLNRSVVEPEVILPAGAPLIDRLKCIHLPCRELLSRSHWLQPKWKKMFSYFRLARHWFHNRPDLIYVNQGGILRPIGNIARKLRIPILCQVQTLEDARWVGTHEESHGCVSSFVCNSKFISEECAVPPDRLSTVYLGYKPKALQRGRSPERRNGKSFEVGLLGRICESKGHYFVIQTIREMRRKLKFPVHFRFIGDAPTQAEQIKVRQLVDENGLADLIEFRGYRTDLEAEFAAMDALIIPSQAEPFGRVFCEAAEAGVPTLVADSGGLGELSRRFGVGIRFVPRDGGNFFEKLEFLHTNYIAESAEFAISAAKMLQSLDFKTYHSVITRIMIRASKGTPFSEDWLGEQPLSEL